MTHDTKVVYFFGGGTADGRRDLRELLGGKGANLAEMARLGLPVPPGFTLTTEMCSEYFREGRRLPRALLDELPSAVERLEQVCGARLGDPDAPLLLSVRSGARASMPGMMDTVLDLGLNDETVEGLARMTGNRRFALDSYRRFCAMFAEVVLGVPRERFDNLLVECKRAARANADADLGVPELTWLVSRYQDAIRTVTGSALPSDPQDQLRSAIEAVFRSWENPRAQAYRALNGIPSSWGTAVTVQAMVFGNLGDDSGTGVAFSRNPATGEPELYGEFLVNAQGEDVVAGVRTPLPISALEQTFPAAYLGLVRARNDLERHFRDLQDMEFTIQRGRLFILQCRAGKRTGFASVRIAVDMAEENLISRDEAIARVSSGELEQLLRPVFAEGARKSSRVLASGLPAGPGAATGRIALTGAEAESARARGEHTILVRHETSPEDIRGMAAADGLLTAWGGMTSHAALVARQMGKVAVVGCGALTIDEPAGEVSFTTAEGPVRLRRGEWLSLDGLRGEVIAGQVETRPAEVFQVLAEGKKQLSESPVTERLVKLLDWADARRRLGVRANADDPEQARIARALGAEGIGLCRTEHMFFGPGRIVQMRRMILAVNEDERRAALSELLPLQRADFAGLFRAMAGRPVTIRLLDPPLHEFLPHDDAGRAELAAILHISLAEIERRAAALLESNPMLGLRGCRLGILHPEITGMQARAMFEAACDVAETGIAVDPQIMVPLVGDVRELTHQAGIIRSVAGAVFAAQGRKVEYRIGTMIEVPRAAFTAGEIAAVAEFFSFGTNDLTQTTYGISRDDVGPVLREYLLQHIYDTDPFVTLDPEGVGALMRIAAQSGRAVRKDLELGICGEHGGDPASIELCDRLGLDYVSCSPSRVPLARLAAAQSALRARTAAGSRPIRVAIAATETS
ncbi:MAG: pyruvate, phosphate dikinase [Myxococcales bacterium]